MSLPSSTRSASPATQAILIHIDVGQHGHRNGDRVHGFQFVHDLNDSAPASSAASVVQSVPSVPTANDAPLLPGLFVVAVAAAQHRHNRAGSGACHAGTLHAPAPHRALFLRPELFRGPGPGGALGSESDIFEAVHAGAVSGRAGGPGVQLPAPPPSPPDQSGCTRADGFLLRPALETKVVPVDPQRVRLEFAAIFIVFFS